MRRAVIPLLWSAFALILLFCPGNSGVSAQEKAGSTQAAVGGAFLGASTGAVLGLLGGAGVCNRMLYGSRCPQVAAGLGGIVAGMSGAIVGAENSGGLGDRARDAGYGALIGGLIGFGLSRGIRAYGWKDVGAFVTVGAAVGSAPVGAGIGFGVGAAAGLAGWLLDPELKLGDALAFSVIGLGLGGLVDWVVGASGAEPDRSPLVIPLQVRF